MIASASMLSGNFSRQLGFPEVPGTVFLVAVAGAIVAVVLAEYPVRPHLFTAGIYSMSICGVFTISHFMGQMVFTLLNRKRWRGKGRRDTAGNYEPIVSVVTPTYREAPALIREYSKSINQHN